MTLALEIVGSFALGMWAGYAIDRRARRAVSQREQP